MAKNIGNITESPWQRIRHTCTNCLLLECQCHKYSQSTDPVAHWQTWTGKKQNDVLAHSYHNMWQNILDILLVLNTNLFTPLVLNVALVFFYVGVSNFRYSPRLVQITNEEENVISLTDLNEGMIYWITEWGLMSQMA